MAEELLIEEWQLGLYVPRDLPDVKAEEIRKALDGAELRVRLLRAFAEAVRTHPALAEVSFKLSR